MLGTGEVVIVTVVIVMVFGASKLPKLGEAVGQGLRNFKKSMRELDEEEATPQKLPEPPKDGTDKGA
jgi:sec-independent protein translocase protein TatA